MAVSESKHRETTLEMDLGATRVTLSRAEESLTETQAREASLRTERDQLADSLAAANETKEMAVEEARTIREEWQHYSQRLAEAQASVRTGCQYSSTNLIHHRAPSIVCLPCARNASQPPTLSTTFVWCPWCTTAPHLLATAGLIPLSVVNRLQNSKTSFIWRERDASKRSRTLQKSAGTHGLKCYSLEYRVLQQNRE